MKTFSAKKEELKGEWYLIDAKDMILGRLATRVADILRGKNKPIFTPHVDTGDFVIVINAEKIRLTGNKLMKKVYYRHSQHPGGLKSIIARDLLKTKPEFLIRHAVRGMLPKTNLGRRQLKKLKVYAGAEHGNQAQCPKPLVI